MFATAIIANCIKNMGKSLYLYPGGTIAPLLHECKRAGVELVVTKAEQGAGYMAIADAVINGNVAFVAVTSGPGVTNILTCIADAFYDSIPLVVFTGQVGTRDLDRSDDLRQRGFQEIPTLDLVRRITKAAFQPRSVNEVAATITEAIRVAESGRQGPVLIDLPMDVQMTKIEESDIERHISQQMRDDVTEEFHIPCETMNKCHEALLASSRPLILAGGGAVRDAERIKCFVGRWGIPIVTSMRGIGVIPTDNPLAAGWVGHTGLPWANWALAQSDCILVLGSRLDLRQTGTETSSFAGRHVFHVDIDAAELRHGRLPGTTAISASVGQTLDAIDRYPLPGKDAYEQWRASLAHQKSSMQLGDHGKNQGVRPDELLACIDRMTRTSCSAVVTGVGSHQQWAARYFTFDLPNKILLTSSGHGTMGYSLPVALGAKKLNPERLVISVDGDGSFQMNLQELALIEEYNLGVKILVMDNNRLGIVSQFQRITFNDDPTTGNFRNPDFLHIAAAYGIPAWDLPEMDNQIIAAWLNTPGPALLRARIQSDAPVSPMLLGGQRLDAMWYSE
ncbi:MAG: thiamine pyrophosphate-binding protein [Geobacter sp.]|nr:thiamine pyrophosphate-binding protein [Geobacter sp.]